MDILKPELVWVEGRCYRINEPTIASRNFQEYDLYDNSDLSNEMELDGDGSDDDFEVDRLESGRYSTTFHVSKHYFGCIIGKKAMTKRQIESDTRTEVKIPRMGEDGDIRVVGSSEAGVKAARRRINMIVLSARQKERPTHFVSIPINSEEIMNSFNKFKEEILSHNSDEGLEESMFYSPFRLHLTLCVMSLIDETERTIASNLLLEAREKIIMPLLGGKRLHIQIKGVSFMQEDARETHVLYGTVDKADPNTQILQELADKLYHHFLDGGFAKPQHNSRESVKLHLTLINTRKAADGDAGNMGGNRHSFNGSRIIDKYANYEFGTIELKEIHLSTMHTSASSDEYYPSTCIVSCTETGL